MEDDLEYTCEHPHYSDGHCASMSCWNYYSKCQRHSKSGTPDAECTIESKQHSIMIGQDADHGRSRDAFAQWSSVVLAFLWSAVGELGFYRLYELRATGASSFDSGSLVFFIVWFPIWHVVLGLVLGAIFRTGMALLGVGAGVLVGIGLESIVGGYKADDGIFGVFLFTFVIFVLPGYLVGARIRGRSGGPHAPR
jgi:hypothetical protein